MLDKDIATIDVKALPGIAIDIERWVSGISREELAESAGLQRRYRMAITGAAPNRALN